MPDGYPGAVVPGYQCGYQGTVVPGGYQGTVVLGGY